MRLDPTWHLRLEIDLREQILSRPKQRAYLARYGRQDFWKDGLTVISLNAAVRAVSEVVEKENELSRLQEDHG